MSVLAELRNTDSKRSKSGRKISDYVLSDTEAVLRMPIAQLALNTGVSEPTVNRFCKSLGLRGFPDFKIALAEELARQRPGITRDIRLDDPTSQVIAKVFEATHASLDAAHQAISDSLIEAAVSMLDEARSIVLCGLGASSSVAMDAQHKLIRFGTPVISPADVINQRMTAATLTAEDCLICISYTGRTVAMVEVAELAGDAGARVLGLTNPESELAARCDLVLPVAAEEDTETYMPMTSRIAQLVLIDVLTTRLAMRRGDVFNQDLRRVKQSLAGTRVPARENESSET